jgi:hypothetical protein
MHIQIFIINNDRLPSSKFELQYRLHQSVPSKHTKFPTWCVNGKCIYICNSQLRRSNLDNKFDLLTSTIIRRTMQILKEWGSVYLSIVQLSTHLIHLSLSQILRLLISSLPLLWSLQILNFRFLDLFQMFHGWLPFLERRHRVCSLNLFNEKIPFRSQVRWTFVTLGVLLLIQQTPIYGLVVKEDDNLSWLRPNIFSSRGKVCL